MSTKEIGVDLDFAVVDRVVESPNDPRVRIGSRPSAQAILQFPVLKVRPECVRIARLTVRFAGEEAATVPTGAYLARPSMASLVEGYRLRTDALVEQNPHAFFDGQGVADVTTLVKAWLAPPYTTRRWSDVGPTEPFMITIRPEVFGSGPSIEMHMSESIDSRPILAIDATC